MRDISTGFLGSYLHRRALRRWERFAEIAENAPPETLRSMRARARAIGQRTATVNQIATMHLIRPQQRSNVMDLPPSTDWWFRPALWSAPATPSGFAPVRNNTKISDGVTLYHDCKNSALSLRQLRNGGSGEPAPFGLQMDIFKFNGSFLSLVVRAPDDAVHGLGKKHILRLSVTINSERPLEVTARLNLKNGPNTEQISRALDLSSGRSISEFDLAYIPFNEARAEQIWFDLFFASPSMNQVVIRDLILSRRPRAEL